jgi:protein gp37
MVMPTIPSHNVVGILAMVHDSKRIQQILICECEGVDEVLWMSSPVDDSDFAIRVDSKASIANAVRCLLSTPGSEAVRVCGIGDVSLAVW